MITLRSVHHGVSKPYKLILASHRLGSPQYYRTKFVMITDFQDLRCLENSGINDFSPLLVNILSKKDKGILTILVGFWLFNLYLFWSWWLQPGHIVNVLGLIINSLFLAYTTLLPGYFFYFVMRMKRPNPALPIPMDWRVAMVVTKAPSEPWPIVKITLEAMLLQRYPHHTWLADEDPSEETIRWCAAHGVQISSRKGIQEYHQLCWPRRTKCKEGNLAYFYDHFGYATYDIVVQLDADHVPAPGYLEAMIRPFIDAQVGYVAAPSICDSNVGTSWVVNGRLFAEATMHGPLQAGFNDGWAPLCIGSHYAVRTAALREIGGLGAELAEDHTTTLMMNASGWRGVFAVDAEAHGEGPTCLEDCMTQEFQWSRSLMTVLLTITPKYWHNLKPHLRFQFLFSQLWYPVFGICGLAGCLLPLLALLLDTPWMRIDYFEFIARLFLLSLSTILPVLWLRHRGCLRPKSAKIISWEAALFQAARSCWVLLGVSDAILSWTLKRDLGFKITPKGENGSRHLPKKIVFPYLVIAFISATSVILIDWAIHSQGYYFLALLTSSTFLFLTQIFIFLHYQENSLKLYKYVSHAILTSTILGLLFLGSALRLPRIIATLELDSTSFFSSILGLSEVSAKGKSQQ